MASRKTKAAAVEAEYNRIAAIFSKLPDNKREYSLKAVHQLAWLNVSIKELQTAIDKNGTIAEYSNGVGQHGTHKNPDVDTLVGYQKLANSLFANLLKLFDDMPEEFENDELSKFIDKADCKATPEDFEKARQEFINARRKYDI